VKKLTSQDMQRICGSYYLGTINCLYDRLVEIFGEPTKKIVNEFDQQIFNCDNKTSCEWIIELDNGNVVTIYDWKLSRLYLGDDGLWPDEITTWNIGGFSKKDYEELKKYIEEKKKDEI